MSFIKWLIGIPLLFTVLWFAIINNDLASIGLWPFWAEDDRIDVSVSVLVVFLFIFGFLFGVFLTWISYAPKLISEKRHNKKLNKAHNKLTEEVTDLKENLNSLMKDSEVEPNIPCKKAWTDIFKRKTKKAKAPEVIINIDDKQ